MASAGRRQQYMSVVRKRGWKSTTAGKPGQPEEVPLLQRLGIGFLRAYVRDSREHLRIAAYSALAELNLPDQQPLLEDGLLDASPIVRARAIEALGRAGLGARSRALRRAMQDEIPSVRIAAMNVLSEAQITEIIPARKVARTEDGPKGYSPMPPCIDSAIETCWSTLPAQPRYRTGDTYGRTRCTWPAEALLEPGRREPRSL